MSFTKAIKKQSKLRMCISGPSGSGKTYTALAIATALGNKVALLDSEHLSSAKYADKFSFDTDPDFGPPYHPQRYIDAINEAQMSGYDVLVIDSLSHAWQGQGGLLEEVEKIAASKTGGNTFQAWKYGTPIQHKLIEAILAAKLHIIATMRSKTEYVIEQNAKGKAAPRKVGTAPIQRDGIDFEFDIAAEMNQDHQLIINKTRCDALDGSVFTKPGKDIADIICKWLEGELSEYPVIKVQKNPEMFTDVIAAFSKIQMSVSDLQTELQKPYVDWDESDKARLRDLYKLKSKEKMDSTVNMSKEVLC